MLAEQQQFETPYEPYRSSNGKFYVEPHFSQMDRAVVFHLLDYQGQSIQNMPDRVVTADELLALCG